MNNATDVLLSIANMSCQGCVRSVARIIGSAPGISIKSVEIGAARLVVKDPAKDVPGLLAALQKAGYPTEVLNNPEKANA
jgi:copper chaperone CopZ